MFSIGLLTAPLTGWLCPCRGLFCGATVPVCPLYFVPLAGVSYSCCLGLEARFH